MHNYSDRYTLVDVGDTHVTLREPGGRVRTAKILEKRLAPSGKVASVLLDRIVHERYGRLSGWKADGCFVTELTAE